MKFFPPVSGIYFIVEYGRTEEYYIIDILSPKIPLSLSLAAAAAPPVPDLLQSRGKQSAGGSHLLFSSLASFYYSFNSKTKSNSFKLLKRVNRAPTRSHLLFFEPCKATWLAVGKMNLRIKQCTVERSSDSIEYHWIDPDHKWHQGPRKRGGQWGYSCKLSVLAGGQGRVNAAWRGMPLTSPHVKILFSGPPLTFDSWNRFVRWFVGSLVRACACSVGRLFVRSVVCSGWVLKAPRHKSSPKGPPKLLVCQYFCTTHKIHETLAPPVPHLWNQYSDFPVNFATTQILTVNKVDTMNS